MICTQRPPHPHTHTTMSSKLPSHNDVLVRALEREREAFLAKTHAAFASYTPRPHSRSSSSARETQPRQTRYLLSTIGEESRVLFSEDDNEASESEDDEYEWQTTEFEHENAPHYDGFGRLSAFRETVRQRQARLAFLRRQDATRKRNLKAAERTSVLVSLALRFDVVEDEH